MIKKKIIFSISAIFLFLSVFFVDTIKDIKADEETSYWSNLTFKLSQQDITQLSINTNTSSYVEYGKLFYYSELNRSFNYIDLYAMSGNNEVFKYIGAGYFCILTYDNNSHSVAFKNFYLNDTDIYFLTFKDFGQSSGLDYDYFDFNNAPSDFQISGFSPTYYENEDMFYYFMGFYSNNVFSNGFNSGYNKGYNDGFNIGYNQGLIAENTDYTFTDLIVSVFDVPIQAVFGTNQVVNGELVRVGGLFNFDFLGYNLTNFFLSILTIGLIAGCVKFFL